MTSYIIDGTNFGFFIKDKKVTVLNENEVKEYTLQELIRQVLLKNLGNKYKDVNDANYDSTIYDDLLSKLVKKVKNYDAVLENNFLSNSFVNAMHDYSKQYGSVKIQKNNPHNSLVSESGAISETQEHEDNDKVEVGVGTTDPEPDDKSEENEEVQKGGTDLLDNFYIYKKGELNQDGGGLFTTRMGTIKGKNDSIQRSLKERIGIKTKTYSKEEKELFSEFFFQTMGKFFLIMNNALRQGSLTQDSAANNFAIDTFFKHYIKVIFDLLENSFDNIVNNISPYLVYIKLFNSYTHKKIKILLESNKYTSDLSEVDELEDNSDDTIKEVLREFRDGPNSDKFSGAAKLTVYNKKIITYVRNCLLNIHKIEELIKKDNSLSNIEVKILEEIDLLYKKYVMEKKPEKINIQDTIKENRQDRNLMSRLSVDGLTKGKKTEDKGSLIQMFLEIDRIIDSDEYPSVESKIDELNDLLKKQMNVRDDIITFDDNDSTKIIMKYPGQIDNSNVSSEGLKNNKEKVKKLLKIFGIKGNTHDDKEKLSLIFETSGE